MHSNAIYRTIFIALLVASLLFIRGWLHNQRILLFHLQEAEPRPASTMNHSAGNGVKTL